MCCSNYYEIRDIRWGGKGEEGKEGVDDLIIDEDHKDMEDECEE